LLGWAPSASLRDQAMDRRQLLKWGVTAGALTGAGLAGKALLLPPPPSRELDDVRSLATRLFLSLDGEARAEACVDYDHPLRQYHNRGVRGGGLPINAWNLDWEQRRILTDLLHVGLSRAGRRRVPDQFFVNWPGVHLMSVVICGDPRDEHYQVILSGPHLMLRLGGRNREGVAFGGPQVYGDQRGDGRPRLPGNVYRYQLEAATRLFGSLTPAQQRDAVLARSPIQTQIEVQGRGGDFPGVAVSALAASSRALARELLDDVLSTWADDDVAYAHACLDHHGGVDGLFLSYYAEGDASGRGEHQVFRLEGPGAVLYFRGHPHVHAFVNVAMDGDAPLSVGELLGHNPAVLAGDGVRSLFERAMRHHTGADLAYYDPAAVAGRLRAGPIRAGDVYVLESSQDGVSVVEVRGRDLSPDLVAQFRADGAALDPRRVYVVATTPHVAAHEAEARLGGSSPRTDHGMLRDAAIAYAREHGFGGTG